MGLIVDTKRPRMAIMSIISLTAGYIIPMAITAMITAPCSWPNVH